MTAPTAATAAARAAVQAAARSARPRLVALLAAPSRDIALAEDAVAAALEAALRTWPDAGVPDNPEGWLLAVARNRQRDVWRSAASRTTAPLDAAAEDIGDDGGAAGLADRRLELLFVCAHPAIDPVIRTPLMLQVVLGVDAARIAAAYAVPAHTMAKRLVRAKARIRDAAIPFAVPEPSDLPERLPPVMEAVYGCLAIGWADPGAGPASLTAEARHLAATLAALLPDQPEVWGLAALATLCLARSVGGDHRFTPLAAQDPGRWDEGLIAEGEALLQRATVPGAPPGRFQLEAAIQAVHCARARTGRTDWPALLTLYRALVAVAPSHGAHVALAAVVGQVDGPEAGLAHLDRLGEGATRLQAFSATRAELLARAGRTDEAVAALGTAISRTADEGTRRHLEQRRWRLAADAR